MNTKPSRFKLNPAEETIQCGHLTIRFLMTGEHSNGSIAAFEMTVPGAQGVPAPAHSHDRYEETIYGIEGILLWTVEGKRLDVGPGQALTIPRGAIHRFDNNTDKDAKALCVITPASPGSGILPRDRGCGACGARRAAGPGKDGGDYVAPRPHTGYATSAKLERLSSTCRLRRH